MARMDMPRTLTSRHTPLPPPICTHAHTYTNAHKQGAAAKPDPSWRNGYGLLDTLTRVFAGPAAHTCPDLDSAPLSSSAASSSASLAVTRAPSASTSGNSIATVTGQAVEVGQCHGGAKEKRQNDGRGPASAATATATAVATATPAAKPVLINVADPPPKGDASAGRIHVRWNVNGQQSKFAADALDSVTDVISLKTPLYPTVSLLSADTRVWCRFCEADIVYRSRSTIGAPAGVRVYCLDGSLLLDEKDE